METGARILIVAKGSESPGGVANYFRLFFQKFNDNCMDIQRVDIGSRARDYYARRARRVAYLREYLQDLSGIVKLLWKDRSIRIVQVNPSLIPVPLFRDGIILLIAKLLRRKTIVFVRGWSGSVAEAISSNWLLRLLFAAVYGHADRVIVLAEEFVEPLIRWGVKPHVISVSRTMFNGEMIEPVKAKQSNVVSFLFLSRMSAAKGIFEIVEAIAILKARGLNFRMCFCGNGERVDTIDQLQSHAKECGVFDLCEFKDYVDGKEKFRVYSQADIFLLPTYHPEGCPNVVLEAMASGLFVISTDIAALKEIIKDGQNGRIVRPRDPEGLAEKMEWAILNISEVRKLGMENQAYAFEHFEAARIVGQIKSIYKEMWDWS